MVNIKKELEKKGHEVFLPESIMKFSLRSAEDVDTFKSDKMGYMRMKPSYIRNHFEKIEKSDAILVVNGEKGGIKNYIGGNTFAEIMIAFYLNKKIFLLNPIPTHKRFDVFYEELKSINPIILNGNLDNIE